MRRFHFKAYGPSGRIETGQIGAESREAVLDQIARRGLVAFEVRSGGADDGPWWAREVSLGGAAIPRRDLAPFFRAFAMMLKARLPTPMALAAAAEDLSNRRLKALVTHAVAEIAEGRRLADALKADDVLPPRLVALLRLGEEANRLPETVAQAAAMLEREIAFRAELRAALTYPAILLAASVAVVAGLVFLLAPSLAPVFRAVRVEPPWVIATMLATRDGVVAWWPLILAGLAALGSSASVLWRSRGIAVERAILRLPVVGSTLRLAESQRALTTLSLMLDSGAPMLVALKAAGDACGTRVFARAFAEAEAAVRAGGTVAETFRRTPLLPAFAVQMIRIGEDSDHLAEMLRGAREALDAQLRHRTQAFVQLLTPVLTLLIGGLVGGLILSTLSAILDINDLAF